jgi:YYY domain-containing protein
LVDLVIWYLLITALGWLTFPLAYRLLPTLSDRGYAISRALGLLLWGYIFWLLASLGILPNQPNGLLFAAILLGGLCLLALSGIQRREMLAWLRSRRVMIFTVEALFLLAFALWAWVRSANPEAIGTEKPMELAFINAILSSPTFPPHDPWLSGYGISYYYFGYILVAMLAKLAGTTGGVAFNLGGILVFALSACGVYGLVFNLLNAGHKATAPDTDTTPDSHPRFTLASLFGPLFLLLVSNLEGFLHVLHTRGLFWRQDPSGAMTSPFWSWLGILDLNQPPTEPVSWIPTRFWWWWRASRVVQDYDLARGWREIIDEFPFFSFLLADLHPHVLAMPFALLVITLALGLFLDPGKDQPVWPALNTQRAFAPTLRIQPAFFLLTAIALGGLSFLNTWDFPLYLALVAAAYSLGRMILANDTFFTAVKDFAWLGFALAICGGLLYFPFYLGFSSQAGGVLPNLIYPTRGAHLWVMFAPLLLPILAFLFYLTRSSSHRSAFWGAFKLSLGLIVFLWLLAIAMGIAITFIPQYADLYLGSLAAQNRIDLLTGSLTRRFTSPGGWITLLALLTLTIGLLWSTLTHRKTVAEDLPIAAPGFGSSSIFTVLLVVFGTFLVLGPEFFYLRDLFGWRMNTIFKFYFQAWLVWSVAAAFGTVTLLTNLRGGWKNLFSTGLILLLAASLTYPLLSLWNKTNGFQPSEWTLDSTAYFARNSPDEMSAIRWLQEAPQGVLAEAVPQGGGSYSEYARVSTLSGKPSVLGWVGHENQWRGDAASTAIGSRQNDLARLYCTRDWDEARAILEQYGIRYVFVSGLERATYQPDESTCPLGLVEEKFLRNLDPAFKSGPATIYIYNGTGNE